MKKRKTGRTIKEKASRIPQIRETDIYNKITEYINTVKQLQSEPPRTYRFLLLMNDLFGIQPGFIEDYVRGIERFIKVKQKDCILKGKVDELFGNLIIEFERDLSLMQKVAEEQLKKYVACLWSQETPLMRTSYTCMTSDGINFVVYSPTAQNLSSADIRPENIILQPVESISFSALAPVEIYYWLDRYFLRKEILSPKTENIIKDFGTNSHAFHVALNLLQTVWQSNKEKPQFKVIYENWDKYLRIVYGSDIAEDELFCRHTYLATLAKLMAWRRLTDSSNIVEESDVLSVLEGRYFKNQGIENFLEEDFYSWIVRDEAIKSGIELSRMLLSLLNNYNLRELSEDVLKSLYQELVDPKTRHDLGEFYTPDWLAHRMVKKLMQKNPEGSFLDASCGSGTFLYLIIREKRDCLHDKQKTLRHILDTVVGIDIHPLAVIVAKTNYILALGDLIRKRQKGEKLNIPIYLANSIRLPERELQRTLESPKIPSYQGNIDNIDVFIPEILFDKSALYDESIDAAREFALENINNEITENLFSNFITNQHPNLAICKDLVSGIFNVADALHKCLIRKRDTIWAYVLKNVYKPTFLKGKFDFVIGNPPWLAYRFAETQYQQFLKEQITKTYLLLSGRGELITHLELGTLFFVRTADLYLKNHGTIAYVLPRSIFNGDQHDGLRQRTFLPKIKLTFNEVWDLENVTPLFSIPSCVLFAIKKDDRTGYPLYCQRLQGKLEKRNSSLTDAESLLKMDEIELHLNKRGKRSIWSTSEHEVTSEINYYKKRFYQGATIVPRSFWFVDVKATSLGFDPSSPQLVTSKQIKTGPVDTYRNVKIEGNIEQKFIYYTILGDELIPFGNRGYRLLVLPIEPDPDYDCYKIIDSVEAQRKGFTQLANWLKMLEKVWENKKSKAYMSIYDRLDYHHGLIIQNPQAKYHVLYPNFQRLMVSCVIKGGEIELEYYGQKLTANNFITESALYCYETNNKNEAYYLSSILNSTIVDNKIQEFRRRHQMAHPNIHKKVFDAVSIPEFDANNKMHLQLSHLGIICSKKVSNLAHKKKFLNIKGIGKLRTFIRNILQDEIKEIDTLVKVILKL
ncbi:MAG: N-6 DNA methylase [candidate division WOR-3 bacterium]